MDPAYLARRYVDAWNQTDPALRSQQVSDLFSADVHYTDPMADVTGRDALDALIGQVQEQFPGARSRLTGDPDGHHRQLRFCWELGPDSKEPAPVAGFDVLLLDETGAVVRVLSFLDRVPA